ncbi:hypothetical protein Atai01_71430 [Amycolatopsis taiwanensis]|uniref:Uncharacterized protein n=1 Tax=Amycolatopsis taiwanensis TaxID=342230 RepID=A0A9W6VKE5_9PSEU|nr:hypothetical protein Atai01_71430 [Amycolatopsis taiwanensis]
MWWLVHQAGVGVAASEGTAPIRVTVIAARVAAAISFRFTMVLSRSTCSGFGMRQLRVWASGKALGGDSRLVLLVYPDRG